MHPLAIVLVYTLFGVQILLGIYLTKRLALSIRGLTNISGTSLVALSQALVWRGLQALLSLLFITSGLFGAYRLAWGD